MDLPDSDIVFAGSVPELYDTYLVPVIFEHFAQDLATRVSQLEPSSVLEVACGTGVVTRRLSEALDSSVEIAATDLNQPMLDYACSVSDGPQVRWRQADVMNLPFDDDSFDVVVCQFAVMFFPNKPAALREIRRVLKPGGSLIFNVWDKLDNNHFPAAVESVAGLMLPEDPPVFLGRTPYGYYERSEVLGHVAEAGYACDPTWIPMQLDSVAESAEHVALAFCHGTPLRNEIEARGGQLDDVTRAAAAELTHRFATDEDTGNIAGLMSAFVVVAIS